MKEFNRCYSLIFPDNIRKGKKKKISLLHTINSQFVQLKALFFKSQTINSKLVFLMFILLKPLLLSSLLLL